MVGIVFVGNLKPNRQQHRDRKGRESLKGNAQAGWKRQGSGTYDQHDQKSPGTPESKKPARRLVSLNSGAGLGNIQLSSKLKIIINLFLVNCQDPEFDPYFYL
ncbi:hypothetical protein CO701_19890 [Citrobacter werkmanii]|nr:hypothetical protein CO701_19890 [Citrobacter werkmanii]